MATARARRRLAWLAARRAIDRLRPKEVVLRYANLGSVSFGDARVERIWEKAKNKPGKHGVPAVIGVCEAADLDLVSDDTHEVVQYGKSGSADSALAIATRRERARIGNTKLLPGTAATSEGNGIRKRPILKARVVIDPGTLFRWAFSFVVGHAPPGRAPRARARYLQAFKSVVGFVKAADLNIPRTWARRLLLRRVFSNGVLHVEVPWWIPCVVTFVDIDSDHPAIDITFWPRKK